MKPTRLTVFAAAALAAIAASLAGCNRPGSSSGDASHSTDNVLWRDELFDYAIETILNRLEEFDSGEMRQQTINRLDQWVRKQKPQQGWQPDPMIAGISGETSAAGKQLVAFAEKIAKLQQAAPASPPEPVAGLAAEARSLGQHLADVAVRLGLIEIARQAEQLLVLAERLGAIESGGRDSPEKTASQTRVLVAQIPVSEVGRMGIELIAYGTVIDPALLAFPVTDSFTFQEAVWLRNVAAWACGEELDDPVKPALALFDWVVKNIQLERTVPALGQGASPLVKKPWETLFLGRGTAIERAWVFVLLARQWNLDAALLGLLGEGGKEAAPARLWAVGVLIEGEVYLFDPSMGLPIVKRGGWQLAERGLAGQPATLSEAAGDDGVLRQMDALQEGDYPVRKEDLQRVVALVEASPGYLTQRMKLVESRLTGDEKIVLSSDPSAQAARFKKCPQIKDAVLWPLPYQVLWQEIHHGQERFQWQQQNIFGSVFGSALWKARAYHFKGVFTGQPSRDPVLSTGAAVGFCRLYRQSGCPDRGAGASREDRRQLLAGIGRRTIGQLRCRRRLLQDPRAGRRPRWQVAARGHLQPRQGLRSHRPNRRGDRALPERQGCAGAERKSRPRAVAEKAQRGGGGDSTRATQGRQRTAGSRRRKPDGCQTRGRKNGAGEEPGQTGAGSGTGKAAGQMIHPRRHVDGGSGGGYCRSDPPSPPIHAADAHRWESRSCRRAPRTLP